ncbi:MAG: prepilin-type N-terminal cleavage/methylation domain-containing protein [Alphaproteobacteria bacterium]|nr:prepilin-type N-terminal cleavage/methylation domain-containing protein [Alphaproteobacteria bacterium]
MKINQKGRSMIEMLGVLAIIGVLSAAGLIGYQKAMMKHKANKTINQMATIINNIHNAFANMAASQHPYANMGGTDAAEATQKMIALNVFPDEMVRTESGVKKVYNVYQGEVTVTFTADGDSFNLDFQNLPKDVAIAIGTIDWGTSDASGLQEVSIGDETTSNP